jgi:cell division protein FtsL
VAGYGTQAGGASYHYDDYVEYGGYASRGSTARGFFDRSDAAAYYGGLFSKYRAGSSVYGGLLDDAPLPVAERRHERRREKAAEKGVHISRYSRPALSHISHAEKNIMVFVAIFISVIFIGVVALEAYSVSIQHDINKKKSETADIQREIDELYVSIEQGKNIAAIEKGAKKELNMLYPSSGQIKYAKDIKAKDKDVDIAEDIRSEVYGT